MLTTKRIPLTLIFLSIVFNAMAQQNYSSYNLTRAEIYFRNPYATSVYPYFPESIRNNPNVYYKLILGVNCDQLFGLYENLYLKINKVKTGIVVKNQASAGLILIDFYTYTKDGVLQRNSVFIDSNCRYLLNESEIEFEKEEKMIEYIKELFPISREHFFIK